MRRILIFGASGFIGKYLQEELSNYDSIEISGYSSNSCNLLLLSDIRNVLSSASKYSALIIASVINRDKDSSYSTMLKNIQMIENCCQAISENPVGHITFLSSNVLYGSNIKKNEIIDESSLPDPDEYYSISKVISEYLLKKLCEEKAIPLTILRLPGIYGPGDNFTSVVGQLVKAAIKDKKIIIYGKGDDIRDYVYVDDICKIIWSAIIHKKSVLMNVATGQSITINDVVSLIKGFLPFPIESKYKNRKTNTQKRVKYLQFNCSVLYKEFPDVSMMGMQVGIKSYVEQMRTELS